jgi:glycosyltransferase involved in cell wall biosynthesis
MAQQLISQIEIHSTVSAQMAVSPTTPPKVAAATCNLLLGGATAFLINLFHAICRHKPPLMNLSVVGFTDLNEMANDFERTGADVRTARLRHLIYEDRLAWGYEQMAQIGPSAIFACLGSESYEMLRLAPPHVARIGIIQSDDPGPYELARLYHPWIDAMVGVSTQISHRLRELPEFAGKPVVAIPYGIEFGERPEIRSSNPLAPLRVIYLGRIVEIQKRISRLAELIRILDSEGAPIHFSIVGSGPEESSFRSSVAACRNIEFLGTVPNSEVSNVLARHDVSILLSDFEGLPLSLLEAMGQGVVPVVSDLESGIREVVTDASGVRVPVGNVDAAARALRGLAADRSKLSELSTGALDLVRKTYSAARMARSYHELIKSLASATPPSWPPRVDIPAPLGLPEWAFQGVPRLLRRSIKRMVCRP